MSPLSNIYSKKETYARKMMLSKLMVDVALLKAKKV